MVVRCWTTWPTWTRWVVGWVVALLGVLGVGTALAMARPAVPGGVRYRTVVAVGAGMAVLLALVLPERRAILFLPPLGLLAFLRVPDPVTAHFVVLILVGLAWAAATLAFRRRCRAAWCTAVGPATTTPRPRSTGPGRRPC